MTLAQFGSTGEKPYAKGEEFIAFLQWTAESRFITGAVYSVKAGQVDWVVSTRDTPWRTKTMKVEDFIAGLLALPDK
jgi:hypothetical protein